MRVEAIRSVVSTAEGTNCECVATFGESAAGGSICEWAMRQSSRDGCSSRGSPPSADCTPVTHGVLDSQVEPEAVRAERGHVGDGCRGTAKEPA
ncbi:hypothetical protein R1flu_009934 [Riccia fluitans]|uniref:Uncharacterized protein n=1 Tax=Riccia fluitans TaxID=41844 RepID=A0ABD1Z7S7_9MARC